MINTFYIPLGKYIDSLWPKNILNPPPLDKINNVWIEPLRIVTTPDLSVKTSILLEEELSLAIPGIDGVSIVMAAAGSDTAFMFEFFTAPSPGMKIVDIPIAIRFANDLLSPATLVIGPDGSQLVQPDTTLDHVDITLAKITLRAAFDGGFGIEAEGGIDLPLCLIGDTGIGIEARGIRFVNASDTPPPGKPAGWSGIHIPNAALWLPGELGSMVGHLTVIDATIGNGGFSGTVASTWLPELATSIGGMELKLSSVAISFVQNCFTQCALLGSINLPFFEAPVDVELGINLDGSISVKLANANGLATLTKPGVLELELQSLGFGWGDGLFTATLSGKIRPLVGGLDWPGFEVRELSIDSKGNVRITGGWIDLRDGYALDFHGFKIEICKIGFGKADDGGKWVGFSGGLNLVDGFSAAASVEGLKVTWYEDGTTPVKVTLDGVGVEFVVPDAVSFKGHVSYMEFTDAHGALVHQFNGDIKLNLLALGMELDAILVIGSALKPDGHTYTFFAIYLAVELPAGIPLWTTGLGLFGLAGLFAIQMEPDKHADEEWYGVGPSDGWYKRPQIGVTDLGGKWRNEEGSLALGAGLTIGTVADNGFTFSGRMLLVLVFPGPILMIEGKANLLKDRSSLSDEPLFRALAVLDGRSGTLLFGLDAQYRQSPIDGELIDIRGGAEAFFDMNDFDRWHLYLGVDEPREKRIRARVFNLFEANAYFMLDAHSLRTGAWVGYDKNWSYGPVRITLEAWLEANAMVNWKPIQFHGDIWAHGKVGMRVFGFGFGMGLDAKLSGDVFTPFHILAELSVELNLPWPIPNVDVDFSLEWKKTPLDRPLIPMVLKEVAVEHFKVTTSWPLPRRQFILPDYDSNNDGFIDVPAGASVPGDLLSVPVVPIDCRPHITFGRSVHDAALIGNNPQPPNPAYERIGDPGTNQGPARVKYSLTAVALEKFSGGSWQQVARKGETVNPPGVPELYGSWAPVPASFGGSDTGAVGQVKLWIWSKNPFDYTRNTGGSWDEWFTDNYPSYPCIPPAPGKSICCYFIRYRIGNSVTVPHICDPDMAIICLPTKLVRVERLNPLVASIDRAACFPPESFMQVRFKRPPVKVDIYVLSKKNLKFNCIDFSKHEADIDENSLSWEKINCKVYGKDGSPEPSTSFKNLNGVNSLNTGYRLDIKLKAITDKLRLTVLLLETNIRIEVFNKNEISIKELTVEGGRAIPQTVLISGPSIASLSISSTNDRAWLQKLCYASTEDADVWAIANFTDGTQSAPIFAQNQHIGVSLNKVEAITVRGRHKFCVVRVCADFGPDPEDVLNRQEMATHLQNATAQWSQVGAVLEPHTVYRMKISTSADVIGEGELAGWTDTKTLEEFAYFRTEGPPGLTNLTSPVNQQERFASGLEDLTRYVKQTVPATVPAKGDKPLLPKPVYRAYDVGVEFNEDYVDMMYRISGRDLGLYIFDNNNLPVRDAAGRLILRPNLWGRTETVELDASEQRWVQVVNTGTCALIDESTIPKDVTINSAVPGQVLKPDTVHQARLLPLLIHETFSSYTTGTIADGPDGHLGPWFTLDQGTSQGPSRWQVGETPPPVMHYLVQGRNIWGGTTDGHDPVKPGAMLILGDDPSLPAGHEEQPHNWTDYLLTAYLRNTDNDAIGLVFRYKGPNNFYRFSMDAERQYRRLVKVASGVHTILAEDDRVYQLNTDYAISIEAMGASLRIYVDGELILSAQDSSHEAGGIGLYCWGSVGVRFSDIRVDDLRNADPQTKLPAPVYTFNFTTSKFAHFTHHVHSYDDKTWQQRLDAGIDTSPWIMAAAIPGSPVSDSESRAFDELARAVLNTAADSFPDNLEITEVDREGEVAGFLVQTSEPFDWSRIDLQLFSAEPSATVPVVEPEIVKLSSASFATNLPSQESVSLLTRDSVDLRGYSIESLRVPGPVQASQETEYLFEDFNEDGHGLLFEESFGTNSLDHYTRIDQGGGPIPGQWTISGGELRQTSNIGGGDRSPEENTKLGTMAICGDPQWSSTRIRARLLSSDDDAIGIAFRFIDADNYYRFSTDNERNYRRLVKCQAGVFTTLWEDLKSSYTVNFPFTIQIDAYGNRFIGQMDNMVLFDVIDESFKLGRIGLYSWLNTGAHFQSLRVDSLDADPLLMKPDFSTLEKWLVLDPAGAIEGPSVWMPDISGMSQTSPIRVDDTAHTGAHLLIAQQWDDFQFSIDLKSSADGALGILVRYNDKQNFYRFSMNRAENYYRMEKMVEGVVSILWQSSNSYVPDQVYRLSVQAIGTHLRGTLDGTLLFDLTDDSFSKGGVGLYAWKNAGAKWSRAWVLSLASYIGNFRILDNLNVGTESAWQTRFGGLREKSGMGLTAAPYFGTHAIASAAIPATMRLMVQARSDSSMPFGVIFRYQDERNYYQFAVSTDDNVRQLTKIVNGASTILWQAAGGYSPGNMHIFVIDTINDAIAGYFDNEKLFTVSDSSFSGGKAGLYSSRNKAVTFDFIRVTIPPVDSFSLFSDKFLEADLTGWAFISEATNGHPPNWHLQNSTLAQSGNAYSIPTGHSPIEKKALLAIAGDAAWEDVIFRSRLQSLGNHSIGIVFRYQDQNNYYRLSMDRLHRYRRLVKNLGGVFTTLWEDKFAIESGRSYEIVIIAKGSMLLGYVDTVLMFSVEDKDLVAGKIGLYCWRNPGSVFSCISVLPVSVANDDWAFRDDFMYLVKGKWGFADAGAINAPSDWKVTGNQLTQVSDISGNESWKGTYAYSDIGSRDWTDYRLSVSLMATTTGVLGIAARYKNPENHYRFEIEWDNPRQRLLKVAHGMQEELWSSAHEYETDSKLICTMECTGQRIRCYVNGVKLCEVTDDGPQEGRIALFTFNNAGARFNFVRVEESKWQTYYRFGKQPTVPAGQRVRILSCNESAAPTPISNVQYLFVAGTGDKGSVHFYGSACDLRLKDPLGLVRHEKTFIRSSLYTLMPEVRILRRKDGCGFFIARPAAVPGGSSFDDGEYRLKLTYRLDNRANDANSQVQREAGSSDAELTQIEFKVSTTGNE